MRIGIIGLGVIGASLGMALVAGNRSYKVVGYDLDNETMATALKAKAVTSITRDLIELASDCDLIFLATSVGAYPEILTQIAPHLRPATIVSDTGSTKRVVLQQMREILPAYVSVVGGHPMAGSERMGIAGADRYLLENAVYIITPDPDTSHSAVETIENVLQVTGARVVHFSPEDHDMMVAVISHLPHMVAVSLMHTLKTISPKYPAASSLAAGGFRDTTRIAAGNPTMWSDIVRTNKDAILKAIGSFKEVLEQMEMCISTVKSNPTLVDDLLLEARCLRLNLPAKAKGLLTSIHEIVVTVPDRPGVIGEIAVILGKEEINIADIEILRVREGDGGTIRIGFLQAENAEAAVSLLNENGILARRR